MIDQNVEKAKVSIITVVKNNARGFQKTASAIYSNDYSPLEWIVVDGGSIDDTLAAIRNSENRISKFIGGPDKGLYDAMNKGLEHATGDWIIFMNAGDVFASNDTISRVFNNDLREYGIVYGDVVADYSGIKKRIKAGPVKDLWKGMVFCHQAVFIRGNLIRTARFNLIYQYGADYHLMLRLQSEGEKFQQLSLPVAMIDTSGISNRKMAHTAKDHYTIAQEFFRLSSLQHLYHCAFIQWLKLVVVGYRHFPVQWMHKTSLFYQKFREGLI